MYKPNLNLKFKFKIVMIFDIWLYLLLCVHLAIQNITHLWTDLCCNVNKDNCIYFIQIDFDDVHLSRHNISDLTILRDPAKRPYHRTLRRQVAIVAALVCNQLTLRAADICCATPKMRWFEIYMLNSTIRILVSCFTPPSVALSI